MTDTQADPVAPFDGENDATQTFDGMGLVHTDDVIGIFEVSDPAVPILRQRRSTRVSQARIRAARRARGYKREETDIPPETVAALTALAGKTQLSKRDVMERILTLALTNAALKPILLATLEKTLEGGDGEENTDLLQTAKG